MRTKFNKQLQRWGVWMSGLGWVCDTEGLEWKPLVYQQKQEAQRMIQKMQTPVIANTLEDILDYAHKS